MCVCQSRSFGNTSRFVRILGGGTVKSGSKADQSVEFWKWDHEIWFSSTLSLETSVPELDFQDGPVWSVPPPRIRPERGYPPKRKIWSRTKMWDHEICFSSTLWWTDRSQKLIFTADRFEDTRYVFSRFCGGGHGPKSGYPQKYTIGRSALNGPRNMIFLDFVVGKMGSGNEDIRGSRIEWTVVDLSHQTLRDGRKIIINTYNF